MAFESILKKNSKVGRPEKKGISLCVSFMGNLEYFLFRLGADVQEASGLQFGDLVDLQIDRAAKRGRIVKLEIDQEHYRPAKGNRLLKNQGQQQQCVQVRFNPVEEVRPLLRVFMATELEIVSQGGGQVTFKLPTIERKKPSDNGTAKKKQSHGN